MRTKNLYLISLCILCLSLAGTACTGEDLPSGACGTIQNYTINAGLTAMESVEDAPISRAPNKMGPEKENMMKTLAVLQFDFEGLLTKQHTQESGERSPYYTFVDLTENGENPAGQSAATLENIPLVKSDEKTTICLLANFEEEDIQEIIWLEDKNRRANLNEFKQQKVSIPYILSGDDDNIGHVEEVYMFGYYEGILNENKEAASLSISLGRMINRLEVNISLEKGAALEPNKHLFISLENLEKEAYVFPGSQSPNTYLESIEPYELTGLSAEPKLYYFYAAPHSAQHAEQATRLRIWYTDRESITNEEEEGAVVSLCNNPHPESDTQTGSYNLNRNSIYHVNITLTEKE